MGETAERPRAANFRAFGSALRSALARVLGLERAQAAALSLSAGFDPWAQPNTPASARLGELPEGFFQPVADLLATTSTGSHLAEPERASSLALAAESLQQFDGPRPTVNATSLNCYGGTFGLVKFQLDARPDVAEPGLSFESIITDLSSPENETLIPVYRVRTSGDVITAEDAQQMLADFAEAIVTEARQMLDSSPEEQVAAQADITTENPSFGPGVGGQATTAEKTAAPSWRSPATLLNQPPAAHSPGP